MEKFWKYVPWITRLMLVPPVVIFAMVGLRHIVNPAESATLSGIAFSSPLGATITRVGLGGFPLACSLFILYCLASRQRVTTGLRFVVMLVSVVLVVRVFGMLADGTVHESMRLVRAEIVLLGLFVVGLFFDFATRRREIGTAL